MPREQRSKMLLAPSFGRLQAVLGLLRSLPWPAPLQRITQRGLERLSTRIPELAELLGQKPRARRASQTRSTGSNLSELLGLLHSRDYATRLSAVQELGNHVEPEAVPALVSALRDRSVEVAVAAATTLATHGGSDATAALLAVLENSEGYYHALTRAAAVHGLGGLLVGEQRAPLHRALRHLDAEVSIAAISALSSRGGPDDAAALLAVVANADNFFLPITRLAAARGLERLPVHLSGDLSRIRSFESDPLVSEVLDRLLARTRAHAQPAS
jgi:hypothetical protein